MWRRCRHLCVAGAQAGAMTGSGDILAQYLGHRNSEGGAPASPFRIDRERAVKFASVGFLFVGPTLRVWYGILNKYVGSAGSLVTLKKVALDQLLFAPAFFVTFLSALKTVEGHSPQQIKDELRATYFDVLKANYCLWPWVQLVNFYIIPLKYQVLTVQTVALFWNTYISWKTHSAH